MAHEKKSTAKQLLEALRVDYLQRVEALTERLRPRFESGELVPWGPWDDRWGR